MEDTDGGMFGNFTSQTSYEVLQSLGNYSFGNFSALSDNLNVSGVDWNVVVAGGLAELSLHFISYFTSVMVKTEKLYDLTGAIGFLIVCVYSFLRTRGGRTTEDIRPFICSFLAFFWALRIGIYAFVIAVTRVEKSHARFHKVKYEPFRFFLFWAAQAIWVFVTSLPVSLINATTTKEIVPVLTTFDWIGIGLWMIGLTIECVADCQKLYLKINIEDSDKWLSTGLWRLVRYPNHLGEIIVWLGIFFTSYSSLSQQRNLLLISLASPLFVVLNIVFLSIPLLEGRANSKWGKDPKYQAYKRNTSALLPWKFLFSSGSKEPTAAAHTKEKQKQK